MQQQQPASDEEIAKVIRDGDVADDSVFEKLFAYYADEMPYGTAKARTGDPYRWIANRVTHDFSHLGKTA